MQGCANQPLFVFQMEASLLAVLDNYRKAVVERVMAPPYCMWVPVVAMGAQMDGASSPLMGAARHHPAGLGWADLLEGGTGCPATGGAARHC